MLSYSLHVLSAKFSTVCLFVKKPLRNQKNKTHINYRKKTTGNQKYNLLRELYDIDLLPLMAVIAPS